MILVCESIFSGLMQKGLRFGRLKEKRENLKGSGSIQLTSFRKFHQLKIFVKPCINF